MDDLREHLLEAFGDVRWTREHGCRLGRPGYGSHRDTVLRETGPLPTPANRSDSEAAVAQRRYRAGLNRWCTGCGAAKPKGNGRKLCPACAVANRRESKRRYLAKRKAVTP